MILFGSKMTYSVVLINAASNGPAILPLLYNLIRSSGCLGKILITFIPKTCIKPIQAKVWFTKISLYKSITVDILIESPCKKIAKFQNFKYLLQY